MSKARPVSGGASASDDTSVVGSEGPWIDNHCHLLGTDVTAVLEEAAANGVQHLITVGTDVESSRACLALAEQHERVWVTAGVHPHEADGGLDGLVEVVQHGTASGRLVAIGECGLDHHYDHSSARGQREAFAEQIRLAHETGLPLVIHTREAWDETFEILDAETVPRRTVFHCFTGGPDEATRCLERGALLSISGIVTFPSASDIRDAVRVTSLDRLMVETDSPYLAPAPHRGKPNRPALVSVVGAKVAEVLAVAVEEVADATTRNATAFYGLDHAGLDHAAGDVDGTGP